MNEQPIVVLSAKQISLQQPLSEAWMSHPETPEGPFVRSMDPPYKAYISPMEARRMGPILKRAIAVSAEALKEAGISSPDAVITGTGYGCIENTELFLDPLCKEGESLLKPTCFMQSTHNTVGAQIAIRTHCHAYNVTYAHKHISFDSALYDAYLQFRLQKIRSALVGGHDEMTPDFFAILRKGGIFGLGTEVCGEAAVAVVLGRDSCEQASVPAGTPCCRLSAMKMLYRPSREELKAALASMLRQTHRTMAEIDAVLSGISGNPDPDARYVEEIRDMVGDKPVLRYKHLFGQSFTASGIGFYVAVQCLKEGFVPESLFLNGNEDAWLRVAGDKNGDASERSGAAPEKSGGAPERSGDAPERSEDAPERSEDAPERSEDAPERSGGLLRPQCLLLYNRGDGNACSLILLEK